MSFLQYSKLQRRHIAQTWFRVLELQFLNNKTRLLSAAHTKTVAGRFTPGLLSRKPYGILYLSENPVLALREVKAISGTGEPGRTYADSTLAWVILNIEVNLQAIVDLTDAVQLGLLGTNLQVLTGNWQVLNSMKQLAPTQKMGQALFRTSGIEGFITPSAESPSERNLNIFTRKLLKGSWLKFRNPLRGRTLIHYGNK